MELEGYLRFFLALAFVLALIGALAWLARRFGPGSPGLRRNGNGKRLALIEAVPLDGRRRLVLLRRDDVEHLVVLGPTSELVVERGIAPPPATAPAPAPAAAAAPAPPAERGTAEAKAAPKAGAARSRRSRVRQPAAGGPAK